MTRAVTARVDLAALQYNLDRVRELAPKARVMAIIKANGYGHGMLPVARALAATDAFGVASLEEGRLLRESGVGNRVVLLAGFFDAEELPEISRLKLDIAVHCLEQVTALERARLAAPVTVWLKVNTGMNRLGVRPEQVSALRERLIACRSVAEPLLLMTHFASADEPDSPSTQEQIACFQRVTASLSEAQSLANSAGILAWPSSAAQWVRPGLMLYGISPFMDSTGADHGLRPVMTLRSRLMAVNACRSGDAVGYGGVWRCPEDMPVGVVSIGYGDGYPRHAPGGTPVLVSGQRAPLIGRVSMDSLCVDLRGCPDAVVGDEVVLWGPELPVEEIARHAGTIPYELLCRLTSRVRFEYVPGLQSRNPPAFDA